VTATTTPLAIIGLGAMGTALAQACAAAGVPVAAVSSRSPAKAEALAALVGARALTLGEASEAAPLVALTVADDAIEDAAAVLGDVAGRVVFHTSGARAAAVLAPLTARGAHIGSWHPLAAVAARTGLSARAAYAAMFAGASVAVDAAEPARAALFALATALGGRPFVIDATQKPTYHLGAAVVAGFSVALADLADQQWQSAGLPHDVTHDGLAHLLRTVADNLAASTSPAAALTGPIVRGDVDAVARQAAAARELPGPAAALYRAHTAHLIAIAFRASRISTDTARRLTQVLHDSFDTR
jgi:predicted short-subunit dehydrogenase-like oxidoreductase (DUF2520 family)